MKYQNILQAVGGTPCIRLNAISDTQAAELWVKVESFNPAGSVKDRPALGMIEDAEARGVLREGAVIVEPTSGNTGIGLAMVAAVKGYKAVFVMAEDMSEERKLILKAYGAEIVLTPADKGTVGAIEEAKRLAKEQGYFFVGQHFNPANPASHQGTADEIWNDFGTDLDILVSTTGTGGTISGLSRYLRAHNSAIQIIATEPADAPILSTGKPGKHKIMGTAPGFLPDTLDQDAYSDIVPITTDMAYNMTRHLAEKEGLFVGISSGAAVAGMVEVARRDSSHGKTLLAMAPDTGERYLSTDVWS
jgi:cysteine synthase